VIGFALGCGRLGYEASAGRDGGSAIDAPRDATAGRDRAGPDGAETDAGGDGERDAGPSPAFERALAAVGRGEALAVDADGNLYVAGVFADEIDFGDGPRPSSGMADGFVASWDRALHLRWAVTLGGAGDDHALALVHDGSGGLYVGGLYEGSISIGGTPLPADADRDAFLARFTSATGAHVWSVGLTGPGGDRAGSVSYDGAGGVYAAGRLATSIDLGAGPVTAAGVAATFVTRYTVDGAYDWGAAYGAEGYTIALAATTTTDGSLVLTGMVQGAVDFGGGTVAAPPQTNVLWASFDRTGAHRFSAAYGSDSPDWGTSVVRGTDGNLYVTGFFRRSIDFGDGEHSAPMVASWVASFTPAGVLRWSRSFPSTECGRGTSITALPSGDVVAAG
jgi:hypothetical protein